MKIPTKQVTDRKTGKRSYEYAVVKVDRLIDILKIGFNTTAEGRRG